MSLNNKVHTTSSRFRRRNRFRVKQAQKRFAKKYYSVDELFADMSFVDNVEENNGQP